MHDCPHFGTSVILSEGVLRRATRFFAGAQNDKGEE